MRNIVLAFASALALSSAFMAVDTAQATEPAGHSFCPNGIESPEELAGKLQRSLAADPAGNRKLEGCHAAPIHFLLAFQQGDPEAGLTSVSQLPAYVRKLVPMETSATTEYRTSCLQERPNRVLAVVMQCVTRTRRHDETIWGNPDTEKRVLWGKCANPGFDETMDVVVNAPPPCVRVRAPAMGPGVSVRGAYIGPRLLPGRCHALLLPGETEYRYNMPEECQDTYQKTIGDRRVTVVCNWDAVEANSTAITGRRMRVQNVSYSFVTKTDGTIEWLLPPEALEGLPTICYEMPDGSFRTLSVGRGSFVNNVATITRADVQSAIWRP